MGHDVSLALLFHTSDVTGARERYDFTEAPDESRRSMTSVPGAGAGLANCSSPGWQFCLRRLEVEAFKFVRVFWKQRKKKQERLG